MGSENTDMSSVTNSDKKSKEEIEDSIHLNKDCNLNKHQKLKKRKSICIDFPKQIASNSTTKIEVQTQTDLFNSNNSENTSSLPSHKKMKRACTPEDSDCPSNTSKGVSSINKIERYGTDVIDLIKGLGMKDIAKLQGAIEYPGRLSEKYNTPALFILNVNTWKGYNPELFLQALQLINQTLVPKAGNISFLTTPPLPDLANDEVSSEMCRLVRILREDITNTEWRIIFKVNGSEFGDDFDFQKISEFCLREDIISTDFEFLKLNLNNVKRQDLVQTISALKFPSLTNSELKDIFIKESNNETS